MEKTAKITRKDYFNAIRAYVETVDAVGDYTADDVLAFIDNEISKIDAKAAKAKEKAAEKRAESDALTDKVFAVLTEEFQVADDITAVIDDPEVTKAKVVNRLSKLIKEGKAVKEEITVEGSKNKKMAYKLA